MTNELQSGSCFAVQDRTCGNADSSGPASANPVLPEQELLSLLLARGMSIATAESCTGGLVAKRITDLAGASAVFGYGVVTYSNVAKQKLLNIPASLLQAHGAVSREVASAMAENARSLAGSDLGLGITGIAGPDGATAQKPLGLVYIALATAAGTFIARHSLAGPYPGRDAVRARAAAAALDMAAKFLAGLPVPCEY